MWLDKRFIFDRNEIVNQRSKRYSITSLRFSKILHVVGNSPTGAKRYDHIAWAHELLKPIRPKPSADEIARSNLEDGKEKTRVTHDHWERSGEFLPKYRRLPKCLPRSDPARRIQICGTYLPEVDRLQSFAVNTEPTKSHAVGNPVECLGYTINLELNPLYAAGIAKMIKIPKKILHFEPDQGLASLAREIVFLSECLHAGYGRRQSCSCAVHHRGDWFARSRHQSSNGAGILRR